MVLKVSFLYVCARDQKIFFALLLSSNFPNFQKGCISRLWIFYVRVQIHRKIFWGSRVNFQNLKKGVYRAFIFSLLSTPLVQILHQRNLGIALLFVGLVFANHSPIEKLSALKLRTVYLVLPVSSSLVLLTL